MAAKSQVSTEFVILVGITFIFIFIFLLLTASQAKEIQANKESILVRDLALKLQDEINLAATVKDGYSRNFTVPDKLDVFDFNLSISSNILGVETGNAVFIVKVPEFSGNLNKGNNYIRKEQGIIYIN